MALLNTANAVRKGASVASAVYAGTAKTWPTAPPFSPPSLSGLLAWYDASLLTGAASSPIASWPDSSGNGNTVSQATGTMQPLLNLAELNGKNMARFDGVDDYLISAAPFTWTQEHTILAILKATSASPSQAGICNVGLGSGPTRASQWVQLDAATCRCVAYDTSQASILDLAPAATQVFHRYTYVRKVGSVEVFVDGASDGATSGGGTPQSGNLNLYIGSGNFAARPGAIHLGELICYSRALSTTERQQVETYLKTKWGL